jgi:hypothetical protein
MLRKLLVATFAGALASCGQATDTSDATKVDATAATSEPTQATAAARGDPCTLIANPETVFGRPVSARVTTMPNNTQLCEWRSAEGRSCGTVTVFGPRWNEVPDVPRNYEAMVTSLSAFGPPKDLPGVGDEAKVVDGGMLGVQIAFRASKAVVNVGAACGEDSQARTVLAERIAHAVLEKL